MGAHTRHKYRKTEDLPKYFTYDPKQQKQTCKLCGKLLSRFNYNLFRHIETMHKSLYYSEIAPEALRVALAKKENEEKKLIKLSFSEEELIQCCVSLVATNGYPPSLMDAPGFRYIIKSILSGMSSTTEINGANINMKINEVASQIRENIRDDVEGNMVSMKIDTASKNGLILLVLHIQYIVRSKITMKTVGFMKFGPDVSAATIRDFVMDVLNEYDIEVGQIYSFSFDSGYKRAATGNEKCVAKPDDIPQMEITIVKVEKMDACDNDDDDDDVRLQTALHMLTAKTSNLNIVHSFGDILQVVVNNTIEALDLQEPLNTCRKLADQLVKNEEHEYDIEPLQNALNALQRDWTTIYDLIAQLEALNLNSEDTMGSSTFIVTFMQCFKPMHKARLNFQQPSLILGDCFKAWLTLKLEVKRLPGALASQLYTELTSQEEHFNENQVITAGVYLDPRFKLLLTEEQNWQAQMHLKSLYDRIENIQQRNSMETSSDTSSTSQKNQSDGGAAAPKADIKPFNSQAAANGIENMDDGEVSLNEFFLAIEKEKGKNNIKHNVVQHSNRATAHRQIMDFEPTRLDPNSNIIEYWNSQKIDLSFLMLLAHVVQAVPVTQSSIQRCEAIFDLLAENPTFNLGCENFQSIVMVKLNNSFKFD